MTKQKVAGSKKATKKKSTKATSPAKRPSKLSQLEAMLRRPEGATLAQLSKVLDWQPHSVRGAMSGNLKKKQGLKLTATKEEGADRVYRIAE